MSLTTGKTRGRQPGSVSFCKIPLSELNRVLKPDCEIMVSVKFAQTLGLTGKLMSSSPSNISTVASRKNVEVATETFEEPLTVQEELPLNSGLKPTVHVEDFSD